MQRLRRAFLPEILQAGTGHKVKILNCGAYHTNLYNILEKPVLVDSLDIKLVRAGKSFVLA